MPNGIYIHTHILYRCIYIYIKQVYIYIFIRGPITYTKNTVIKYLEECLLLRGPLIKTNIKENSLCDAFVVPFVFNLAFPPL